MADKSPEQIVQEAFSELKAANDANMKKHDAVLDDKLRKIDDTLNKFEPMNQQVTLVQDKIRVQQEALDRIETILNRQGVVGGKSKTDEAKAQYLEAFDRVIRKPADARDPADLKIISDFKNTLVKSDDAGAGYLLAPSDVNADIIKDVIEMNPMRALATVRTIGSTSLKQPRRTGTASATRVGERTARTNTGDPAYGMIETPAPEMFARAEISMQMLEDSDYDLMAELRSEFAEQFAYKEGVEFIIGTGADNQAEGLMVASGIGEVKSGDANLITADGLIGLYYGLKTGYTANARFILNRGTIAAVRKLKGSDGHYLWTPGIPGAVPNTILGAGYVEMPSMPDIAAGAFPVAFGDFRRAYVIVDRIAMSFQSDFTTGADDGVVVYRARKRVGGGTRQTDAVKKLKIAA